MVEEFRGEGRFKRWSFSGLMGSMWGSRGEVVGMGFRSVVLFKGFLLLVLV